MRSVIFFGPFELLLGGVGSKEGWKKQIKEQKERNKEIGF
jgi:hypothetical protein